jgi:hypothetical protein
MRNLLFIKTYGVVPLEIFPRGQACVGRLKSRQLTHYQYIDGPVEERTTAGLPPDRISLAPPALLAGMIRAFYVREDLGFRKPGLLVLMRRKQRRLILAMFRLQVAGLSIGEDRVRLKRF